MTGTATKMQAERPSLNDEQLVRLCRAGNEQAWSSLIDKYKNLIYSIPIKLGLYQDAADIFQAVCLDLLAELPRLREPRALPKWLMQTCYHKCLHFRKLGQKQVPFATDQEEQLTSDGPGTPLPEEILVQLQREQTLRNVLAELSPRCQRMIKLLFFEIPPRPYQEVARDLGLATGSIGFIRGRCLTQLKKQLYKLGFK